MIDGVRLGQNRKRPGSARRYIIRPGTGDAATAAVAAAVFDDRQDTTQRLWRQQRQQQRQAAAAATADIIYGTQYDIIYPRHMACFYVPMSTTIKYTTYGRA